MAPDLEVLNLQIAYARIRDVSFLSRMHPLAYVRKRVIMESRPFPEKRDADEGFIPPSSGTKADGKDQEEFWLLSQQWSQEDRLEIKTV